MRNTIADTRRNLKITQEDLAKRVDVTRQTIIALEQGKYNPSLILAYKIKKELNIDYIENLFDLES